MRGRGWRREKRMDRTIGRSAGEEEIEELRGSRVFENKSREGISRKNERAFVCSELKNTSCFFFFGLSLVRTQQRERPRIQVCTFLPNLLRRLAPTTTFSSTSFHRCLSPRTHPFLPFFASFPNRKNKQARSLKKCVSLMSYPSFSSPFTTPSPYFPTPILCC